MGEAATHNKTGNKMLNFVKESDVGTDPRYPEHTGSTTWKCDDYTIIEKRLGGFTAKRSYTLFWKELEIAHLSSYVSPLVSLRDWITTEVEAHKARSV